ncbi:cysteine hydrolase [Streptomyces sp. MP131-18]|uniref:cysteine hydrolase family protein n=1 Tax=Streptomyces sp. MP131-18 TaxID=1857892 RepID=UPI000D1B7F31|nr:cysteine hydrolase [Streptomyces sp. MP131-18]
MIIEARPGPLTADPQRMAVVVVDMQNDFGAEGGGVHAGGGDISVVRAAVAPTAAALDAARRAGIRVIYLKHGYAPDLSDMGPRDSKNWLVHATHVGQETAAPDGSTGRILVRGTWNTRILAELTPRDGDLVIGKTRFSGFHGTGLDATLRGLGVDTLIVTGCTTSVCVESTVRDAMFLDYRPVVLADCTGEPQGREHHESTLVLVERVFGWVAYSAAFRRAVDAPMPG